MFEESLMTVSVSLPTIEEIRQAQQFVYSVMLPTPQIVWPLLCERLGTETWVKHENHTPIGAFKARTAVVYAEELFRESKGVTGLVTATRGNHGQSVALAARRFGVPAHIVVPHGNSAEKNAAMRAQGATLIEFGSDFQESKEHAQKLAGERSLALRPFESSQHREGSCDLLAGIFLGRPGSRRGLCADWARFGHLVLLRRSQWTESEDEDYRRGSGRSPGLRTFV